MEVIFSYNASVNFYMFHGGTTYGFLNGANALGSSPFYAADTSSYGIFFYFTLEHNSEID